MPYMHGSSGMAMGSRNFSMPPPLSPVGDSIPPPQMGYAMQNNPYSYGMPSTPPPSIIGTSYSNVLPYNIIIVFNSCVFMRGMTFFVLIKFFIKTFFYALLNTVPEISIENPLLFNTWLFYVNMGLI